MDGDIHPDRICGHILRDSLCIDGYIQTSGVVDFAYSTKNPQTPLAYCEIRAMHSRLELILVGTDESGARRLCREAEATVSDLERKFDRHNPESPVSVLNAGKKADGIDDELYFALELCEQFRMMTEGYFDIAALSDSRHRPAYSLEPSAHGARFASEGTMLDFGGFAKGYALERIRKDLNDAGITKALLNFGNSSVVGIGTHPFGDCWKVSSEKTGSTFDLVDSAVSISGRTPDGRDHIVDPHSAMPVAHGMDIAVTGRSALVCEMLSTAVYAAPEAVRKSIMASFEGYEIKNG